MLLVAAGLVLVAFVQRDRAEPVFRNQVLARVNGTPISVGRFNESYVNYLIRTGRNDTPQNRYLHLNNLLDAYVLAEEARRRGLDSDPKYRAYHDRKLRHTVGGEYYREIFLSGLPALPEEEIRQVFARSHESVVVRHLLFHDPEEANRAYERLKAGEDFIRLANEVYQTEEFDSMAGYLGMAGYWELDDFFAEAAFSQPVGIPGKPVRTSYGYHIILVEDHLRNPLLTEDAYNARRKGLAFQAHQRKRRVAGTRFVRDYMASLNVQVNEPAMYQLRDAIRRLHVPPDEVTRQLPYRLSTDEVMELESLLTPQTVLVTYDLDGERRTFTALDYYRWLEELPFREVRSRPAASVGRALRNEVLALRGLEAGLDDNETVKEYMQFASNAYLAELLRGQLRTQERAVPTDAEVEEAFSRLGYRTLKTATADFWLIEVGSFSEGNEVKKQIEAGARPASFPAYSYHANEDLERFGKLGDHIRRTGMNRPIVMSAGADEWYVLQVDRRDLAWTAVDDEREEIVERLATYMPEAKLAEKLRAAAEVAVDSTLFREIMEVN